MTDLHSTAPFKGKLSKAQASAFEQAIIVGTPTAELLMRFKATNSMVQSRKRKLRRMGLMK